jgi:ABC-type Fe3+/spermidine/putrescine transport system ATPase subunit
MPGSSVELRNVSRAVGGRPVLRGCSFEAAAGEWTALLGPSGAGKTTLLRLVAGFERPEAGELRIDGRSADGVAPRERGVGMLFQDLALWPYLTVEEHVGSRELIARFGLAGLEARRPGQLSGGEKQRLALARSVANDPRILLLDEPFSGLDPLLRRSLADSLAELQRERGFTVLVVSHHLEAPVARASKVGLLRDGRIEQSGSLSELRANPANDWVAAFLADESEVDVR